MTDHRISQVYLRDGDVLTFDSVNVTRGGWLSCYIEGSQQTTKLPPNRVRKVVTLPPEDAPEVSL